ncbi:asparagine synthase (glutamine-hydrolyzing) [Pseudomonas sp. FP2309]|uniref:asparagine synthase (glutamine-hydrolyzing) n=1 Tax=Pseudomonas sp. FP2309 TaxID=2954091 RepID=UPI002736E212|nr:asparagine synthase (glutamine-hydrolyzing) [Pseudomonas sp. FP2309]WLH70097.1 asparagine synthase (glutamine-hydrolyzing) [Pseudomonas sp. FP2309]
MCGLVGYLAQSSVPLDEVVLQRMTSTLTHRGPDAAGYWTDYEDGVALGHRRLSILDLSPAGSQPMVSPCGRYVIAFNGEIYNHLDLRATLQSTDPGLQWRGHADTETLLIGFSLWGVEKTLQAAVGMFAIALWDRQEKLLTLVRDRSGEKPLYYGWQGGIFLFGSELKALKAHPAFCADVDRNALVLLLRHNCVPAPHCIYEGMFKLMPGTYMQLRVDLQGRAESLGIHSYWSFNTVVAQGLSAPFIGTDSQAVDLLESRLLQSLEGQMLSDVPLGAFLSGGVDSSTIVSLMQAQSARPIRTFTIGFEEGGYDEAVHAKDIARHLGTEHTELYVRPEDALAVIPQLPSIYCEPFSDSSQIPTYLLSKMAREHVKVALSGDGGDELFGGYNRYLSARKVWGTMQRLPRPVRAAASSMLKAVPPVTWDKLFKLGKPLIPKRLHITTPGDKAHKLADVLGLSTGEEFFYRLASHWDNPAGIVLGASEPETLFTRSSDWPVTDSFEHWMMAMDAQTYMADDILVKVDRAAMAASLETRSPLLDHRVVELAWNMPLHYKIRAGEGKWLLKQVLYRHVPKNMIDRPKQGFGIPLDSWLRGPLREWAASLLDSSRLESEGYFRSEPIRKMWEEHLLGVRNWQHQLWTILMFQAWLEEQRA